MKIIVVCIIVFAAGCRMNILYQGCTFVDTGSKAQGIISIRNEAERTSGTATQQADKPIKDMLSGNSATIPASVIP